MFSIYNQRYFFFLHTSSSSHPHFHSSNSKQTNMASSSSSSSSSSVVSSSGDQDTKVAVGDKYRSFMHGDAEMNTHWRHGGPPIYDDVNKLFHEERTKVWEAGSLEETVQNAIKTWEMELSHKTRIQDFKTINPDKFKLFVNGREGLTGEETLKLGSYNALLKTSLPEKFQYYKADEETFESSHDAFRKAMPRGFAWEVVAVYSGPPLIAYKFRHWGYMEGPFKGHTPTGEKVEFYGLGVLKVDETLRVEEVEVYYEPGELFGGLLKEPPISSTGSEQQPSSISTQGCPFYAKGD